MLKTMGVIGLDCFLLTVSVLRSRASERTSLTTPWAKTTFHYQWGAHWHDIVPGTQYRSGDRRNQVHML